MKQNDRMKQNNLFIDSGKVLKTNYEIKSFKLLGNLYTTNKHRSKNRPYSFDDSSWRVTNDCIFEKIQLVLFRKAYKVNKN